MDCMEAMKQFPDKHFDLAIVDPPYGIGDEKLTQGGTWASKYKSGDAKWDIKPDPSYFSELFRISKNQIIWGGNYFTDILPVSRCWICWDKIAHMETMADHEMAWCSFDKNAKIFKVCRAGNQAGERRIHITQKPVKLYKWLLSNYAKEGDKILDTHLGGGSSRIAAYQMGYDFTGYEIDKEYFEAAEKRFKLVTSQTQIEF